MSTQYVRFSLDGSTYYGQLQGDQITVAQGDIFSDYQLTDGFSR